MTISDLLGDGDRCYRAALSRDARFDGVFYVGREAVRSYPWRRPLSTDP